MTFKVSWDEGRSGERRTRKCETADEARGFIRGLRIHPDHANIAVRRIAEDGQFVKMKVAELFDAPGQASEPPAAPAPAPVEPQAPAVEAQEAAGAQPAAETQQAASTDTLAALATALVEEVGIAQPVAAALAVVEEPAAEPVVEQTASAPANDPHPAPQRSAASTTASMLRMAERWL